MKAIYLRFQLWLLPGVICDLLHLDRPNSRAGSGIIMQECRKSVLPFFLPLPFPKHDCVFELFIDLGVKRYFRVEVQF